MRPSAASTMPSQPDIIDDESRTHKNHPITWRSLNPFSLPPDQETAAIRVVHNLARHCLYYTLFLWTVLFITLIPQRPASLLCLVITSNAGVTYVLMLKAYPRMAAVLNRFVDPRVIVGVLVVAVVVEMMVTNAGKHLVLSVAGVAPVVFVHAVFWVGGVAWPVVTTEAVGEMEKLVGEDGAGDMEAGR